MICLVSVLTGCIFSGRQFSRGYRLILLNRRLKQERRSQVCKKHLTMTLMYRLKTVLKSRKVLCKKDLKHKNKKRKIHQTYMEI